LRRSSIGLHSFQGIFALPQKARLCNPCARNELSPLSQEGHMQPDWRAGLRIAAASNALAGRLGEAQKAIARVRQLDPARRISNINDWIPLRRSEDIAKFAEGLRKAGLPE
jgi:hypothetical protein